MSVSLPSEVEPGGAPGAIGLARDAGLNGLGAAHPRDLDELLTARECATWLKKPRRWVIERSRSGQLPVVRLSQRDFRYHPRTVLAALTKGGQS